MRFILRIAAACAFWYAAAVSGQQPVTTPVSAIPSMLTLSDALQLLSHRSPAILAEAQSIPVAQAKVEAATKLPNPILMANSESYPAFSSQPGSVRKGGTCMRMLLPPVQGDVKPGGQTALLPPPPPPIEHGEPVHRVVR